MAATQRKNYRGTQCLNCKHPLDVSDKFCSNCGQKNSEERLTLKHFFDEFLANFYAYDSKIKRTLVSLFTKPGNAALDFIAGKRLQYANPFRFYLSISIVYFLFTGFLERYHIGYHYQNEAEKKIKKELSNQRISDTTETKPFLFQIHLEKPTDLATKEGQPTTYSKESEIIKKPFLYRTSKKWNTFSAFYSHTKSENIDSSLTVLGYQNTRWNRYVFKKSMDGHLLDFNNKKSLQAFKDYFMAKIPFLLFLSLPLITVIFSLVYYTKKLNYAEHLVFVFNFMTFVFSLIFIEKITHTVLPISFSPLLSLGIPFYFYKALRNFYQQSRWITIIKFVILTCLLSITTLLVALFILVFVFLIY